LRFNSWLNGRISAKPKIGRTRGSCTTLYSDAASPIRGSIRAIMDRAYICPGKGFDFEELVAMHDKTYPVTRTEEEWRRILTPEQYDVMRLHGTEAPGSCALLLEKRPGKFSCAGCGQPLFESKLKFESGTGWPSFNDPIESAVETSTDRSHGMVGTEVHCANCGSHLGHVFDDGPTPTHLRYCINGVAMNFSAD
jgi:peptide-methionine (R)-S-oxide reductase